MLAGAWRSVDLFKETVRFKSLLPKDASRSPLSKDSCCGLSYVGKRRGVSRTLRGRQRLSRGGRQAPCKPPQVRAKSPFIL